MENTRINENQNVPNSFLEATPSDNVNKYYPTEMSDADLDTYVKLMNIIKDFVLNGGDVNTLSNALNGLTKLLPNLPRDKYAFVTTILSEFSKSKSPDGTYNVKPQDTPDFKNMNWGDEKVSWAQVMTNLDLSGLDNDTTAKIIMDFMKTYYETIYQKILDQTGGMIDSCEGGNDLSTQLMQMINLVTTVNKSDFKLPPETIDDIPTYILDQIRTSPDSKFREGAPIDNPLPNGPKTFTWTFDSKTGRYVPFDVNGSTKNLDAMMKYYSTLGQGVNRYVEWYNDYFKGGPAFSTPDFSTNQIDDFLKLRNTMVDMYAKLETLGEKDEPGTVMEALGKLIGKFNVFGSITDLPTNVDLTYTWVKKSDSAGSWSELEISYMDDQKPPVSHTVGSVKECDINQGMRDWAINMHSNSTDVDNLVTALNNLRNSAQSKATAGNSQLEYVVDLVKKIAEVLQSVVTDTAKSLK